MVIDKPQGWTSHDVVAHVKGKLKAAKVGHLGTLDPIATGVLVLVIDSATKCASRLGAGEKEYLAVCKLGEETDTYDSEGRVVRAPGVAGVTVEEVKKAADGFRGRISQVPPMYSAVKTRGTPLYKLARKGVTVEREAREVTVRELEITALELPVLEFRAVCSGGTYLRSICHDLGEKLGCGGHLQALRRTRSGAFGIDEAAHPKLPAEELAERIIPLDEALRRAGAEAGTQGPEA